ncbi:MAG: Gfo/Idh/MocA family oxidoreductase, partial [Anaerolineae bacterium]|nr:Gfo/Idh/MocA family oxidoreductase [Anaerolineae bacterium]
MQPIRVGVIGLGQIAQIMHIPYLHTMPGFELAAVCDLSAKLVEEIGELYHVPGRYTDASEMITKAKIDAVIICTTFDHADIALAAIERGKHVLVEKPLCETPALAREVAAAADRANVHVMVAYMKRYDPGFLCWQEEVRDLQEIRLVRVHDFCHNNQRIIQDAYELLTGGDIPQEMLQTATARAEARYLEALGEAAAPHLVAGYKLALGLGV